MERWGAQGMRLCLLAPLVSLSEIPQRVRHTPGADLFGAAKVRQVVKQKRRRDRVREGERDREPKQGYPKLNSWQPQYVLDGTCDSVFFASSLLLLCTLFFLGGGGVTLWPLWFPLSFLCPFGFPPVPARSVVRGPGTRPACAMRAVLAAAAWWIPAAAWRAARQGYSVCLKIIGGQAVSHSPFGGIPNGRPM